MKLEALKNQGARSDLTCGQFGHKLIGAKARDIVADESGDNARNVQRFIRLTSLIPELLDMVDEKKIAFNPAVELSYLDESQQRDFLEAMNDTQNAPSLSQAQRLKRLAQEGHFSYDVAFAVMGEEKKDIHIQRRDPLRPALSAGLRGRRLRLRLGHRRSAAGSGASHRPRSPSGKNKAQTETVNLSVIADAMPLSGLRHPASAALCLAPVFTSITMPTARAAT